MGFFDFFRKVTWLKAKGKVKMRTPHDQIRLIQVNSMEARKKLHKASNSMDSMQSLSNRPNITDKELTVFLDKEKDVIEKIQKAESAFLSMMSDASSLYSQIASKYMQLAQLNSKLVSSYKPQMPANPKNMQKAILEYQTKVAKVQSIAGMNTSLANAVEHIRNNLKGHSKLLLERRGVIEVKK